MNRIKRCFKAIINISLIPALILIIFGSCEKFEIKSTIIDPKKPYYFNSDILPIIEKNSCASVSCHGGPVKPDLSSANAYNSLKSGGYITGSNPEATKLYKQLTTKSTHSKLTTPDEKKYILYWITQGAPEK